MANNYGLFFSRKSDGLVIRLPVNPETLPAQRETANDDENVLGIGPVMIPRIPELKKITISSYFPGRVDSLTLTSGDFKDAAFYVQFFEQAMLKKEKLTYTPVRYYEDGEQYMLTDNGFDVLVTNFKYEERGAETGDFYYDLEITEYRDYTPMRMQIQSQQGTQAAVATTEPTRDIPQSQLYVGALVVVNGPYYYSAQGAEPHGNGNGKTCKISRILTESTTNKYPIHITTESGGALGWVKKDALQVVSDK